MSDAKKCDKCGKFMDTHTHRVEITLEYQWQGKIDPKHIDLCLACQGKFDKFLREKDEG